jgi:hypothetical protein
MAVPVAAIRTPTFDLTPRGQSLDAVIIDDPTPAPASVAQTDEERRRSWRLLEPHEVAVEGDRYANWHNHTDMVSAYLGRHRDEISCTSPVIRRVVLSRDGFTAPSGMRIADPTETVPPPGQRCTERHPEGVATTGEPVGDNIIFINIVEVENA